MEVTGRFHTAATQATDKFRVLSVKVGRKSGQYGEEKILLPCCKLKNDGLCNPDIHYIFIRTCHWIVI